MSILPFTLILKLEIRYHSAYDKGPAWIEMSGPFFYLIYILVILVRKQFATFLHISLIKFPVSLFDL